MIDALKTAIDNQGTGTLRTDGGTLTVQEDGDAPDSQYRLGTSDGDDARTEPEEEESTELPSDRDAGEATEPPLEIDQVFAILKNERRRYVLEYLLHTDEAVRLGELAEQIAAWENEKDVRAITSQERKRVYVGLYQGHLPKMDDVGAISYNKPRGKIEPGPNIEFFYRYLPANNRESEESTTVRSAVSKALPFLSGT